MDAALLADLAVALLPGLTVAAPKAADVLLAVMKTASVVGGARGGRHVARRDGGRGVLSAAVRAESFGATLFEGWGQGGRVDMVLSVVRRREARRVCEAAQRAEPTAFLAVDSPRSRLGGRAGGRDVGLRDHDTRPWNRSWRTVLPSASDLGTMRFAPTGRPAVPRAPEAKDDA